MMFTAYILLALGLLLVLIEFFLPGWIIGILGSLLLVLSIVFFAVKAKSGIAVFFYIVGVFVLLALFISFMINRIRKGKFKGIFLNTVQEGYLASHFEKELIGKTGEALSDLKPSGHILIEKKRYQAVSKTGYLVKGTKIQVVGGEGAHLIVTEQKVEK